MTTIYCFTSTGNSLYVAKRLAELLDTKHGIEDATMAEKNNARVLPMNREQATCDDDVIGIVFPAFFWGLPRVVERFINEINITNKNAFVFTIVTYGGVIAGLQGIVKNLLAAKGIELNYGAKIKMVDNYIPAIKPHDSEKLRKRIDENIVVFAGDISHRVGNRIPPSFFMNTLLHKNYPDEKCDQNYTISSSCNGCATCQKICPVGNISMEDNRPVFQHGCEHCMACIQSCPAHAIDWKNKVRDKKRFRNSGVSLSELIAFYHDQKSNQTLHC